MLLVPINLFPLLGRLFSGRFYILGTVLFLSVGKWGGGGGWVLLECEGGQAKNGFKGDGGGGGVRQKYWVKREGVTKRILKRFWSDGICDIANNLPEWQKPAFLMFSLKFMFSALSIRMPPAPLLYYAQNKQFYPTKMPKK